MTVRGKKPVSVDPDEGHVIRNLNEGAKPQRDVQLPAAVLAKVMSAIGLDYHKNSDQRGWVVAMVKSAMNVQDLKAVTAEQVENATEAIVAYAKEHEQSGSSDRAEFKVEWADEKFADLFFSDARKPEWDILTYSNKGPHTASSLARLELYSKGRKIDEKVLDEIVAHVTGAHLGLDENGKPKFTGLYARRNDGAVEKCNGCRVEHTGQPYTENKVYQEWENGHLKSEYVKLHTKFPGSDLYETPQTVGSFVHNPGTDGYDYMCDRPKFHLMKMKPEVEKGPDGKELTITIRGEVKPKFAREPDPKNPGKMRTKMVPGAEFVDRDYVARVTAAKDRKAQGRAHDDAVDEKYRPAREERGRGGYRSQGRGSFNTPRDQRRDYR